MEPLSDIAFFSLVVRCGSLAAAAQELGVTPPSVSKRLAALEARLKVRLLNRTTRRISLTPEGEIYVAEGERIAADLQMLEQRISGGAVRPQGRLKLGATLGFGRRYIAPALAEFARRYPQIEVQLHLSDRVFNLVEGGFDAIVRFGELPDVRLTARKLASNRRLLCASPEYVEEFGTPASPRDLQKHRCIFIRESDEIYGQWHFRSGVRQETIKVRGHMSTNDGECALTWALAGQGIVMRSEWDAAPLIRSGKLQVLLEDWDLPNADIFIVFPTRSHLSAKTRVLVDYLLEVFQPYHMVANSKRASHW
ncbi:transcriptional regulator, LysR family [Noviherbaspirillum humi]|uniref:Transcriptional regulator, LysR family n=1 Tax=Noviherbaspirillum humi TaxID=1688639 RepID=A0A239L3L3_9BURK|nr:LysR family transcriptional regulator [Noviherbaspirillum humi]SNT24582.1 transcriptional regulator, LysR family [Noviherbaspirillum humi]